MVLEKKSLVWDHWVCRGKRRIKRLLVASFAAALLASGVAGPASAAKQTIGDGLVNVTIGDIQIKDINITAAVDAVVQACPNVDATVVLGVISAIDAGDARQTTFCEVEDGDVRVRNN